MLPLEDRYFRSCLKPFHTRAPHDLPGNSSPEHLTLASHYTTANMPAKEYVFIIIQSEISRIICAMAFMYAWAWTSISMCVNTQQAVCYRFHSIWIYFPTEASLDLVVWYFYSYSCLNTDGPIVLQSAERMQLLWLNKDTGTIQPSTSHLWSSPLIWHLWWPFFSFSQVSTLLARRLTVCVLSQT